MAATWPEEPRTREIATSLYEAVADKPLVSVHAGLTGRYLADDSPITDPVNLVITDNQAVSALLRAHGIDRDFGADHGRRAREASRKAYALVQGQLRVIRTREWSGPGPVEVADLVGLPAFGPDSDPAAEYAVLAERLAEHPVHPRQILAASNLRLFATSDDPADELAAHQVLAADPIWAGRVVPTFSPDRYLRPGRRGWRTDADLLAEVTGVDTDQLSGFLEALQQRREYFRVRGALLAEHHASDIGAERLDPGEAEELYRLGRTGELLPAEAVALQRHLLWESGRMSADDGLVMALYPPAGFRSATDVAPGTTDDRGVAERIRPLLTSFGAASRFRLWLFSIDLDAYDGEIVPLAATCPQLVAVPPTRFADDPRRLRAARARAVAELGSRRALGIVDDMSGPLALAARHRLARRLDAGALAGLVVAGQLSLDQAYRDLGESLDDVLAGPVEDRTMSRAGSRTDSS